MKNRRGAQFTIVLAAVWLAFAGGLVDGQGSNLAAQELNSNNLWLQINSFTNDAASLVIHRPWNDTNLTHDLFYASNLAEPVQWRFETRCLSTNAVLGNLCGERGYFMLGQTNGSLTVDSSVTPQVLAQMLVPPGLTPMNVVYTGTNLACGTFSGGNGCGLPLDSGVILATGDITNAIGPNDQSGATTAFGISGDSDLGQLVGGGPTFDAAVLEFDVVATNDMTLGFEYIFASEEYPEWIGPFNDPMAIFVDTNRTGTNWINTNNIALVPGTALAVSVNTVNGGYSLRSQQIPPTNPQYYVDNHDPSSPAMPPYGEPAPVFNVQYDGMTVRLTAQTQILANVTNHVKIAIADFGDDLYDSAVFVRSWSPPQ
jgi:hypothetical protein